MIYRRFLREIEIYNNFSSRRVLFRNSLKRRVNKIIRKRWILKRIGDGIVG